MCLGSFKKPAFDDFLKVEIFDIFCLLDNLNGLR